MEYSLRNINIPNRIFFPIQTPIPLFNRQAILNAQGISGSVFFLHIYSNTHDYKQNLTRVSDNSGYERLLTYDGPHNITSRIKKASGDHYTECLL